MPAPLVKTRTPGIYKRGTRYVFSCRADGKQRGESCRTLEEARRAKAARLTDIGRGELEERSKLTLREYAIEWVDRYQGDRPAWVARRGTQRISAAAREVRADVLSGVPGAQGSKPE